MTTFLWYDEAATVPQGVIEMLKTKLHTGSPMPKKPMSKRTSGAVGGKSPEYNPKAAAKHLDHQCHNGPANGGPMKGY